MARIFALALIFGAFGIILSGCGSSGNSKTVAEHKVASEAEHKVGSELACTSVVASLSTIGTSLNISSSSLANVSSTKEHLHELATYSSEADKYTIGRLTEVLSRLEVAIEKASGGNYPEANGALTGIGDEMKELIPKILMICGKSPVSHSASGGSQSTTSTTPSTTTEASGEPNCREAAVQTALTCELEGTTVLVAHGHGEIRLSTLAARIEGIRTTSSFSSGVGTTTAHGVFLVISLHVTNMASTPQVFDGVGEKQVALSVSKHYYSESFEAENESDKQSFITNEEPIQPGESKTGDLVFDVPSYVVNEVRTLPESGLFIGNFGDNEIEGTPSGTGLITTKGI